jgi:hypothetical protein
MTPGKTDQEFIAAFEACTLPNAEFTHQGHLRMAWYYLRGGDYEAGLTAIRDGIKRYANSLGATAKYNETVTVFYARLVHHCLSQEGSRALTWGEFAERHPILFDRVSPPSLRHYKKETLLSDEARTRFVEPDVKPLPPIYA